MFRFFKSGKKPFDYSDDFLLEVFESGILAPRMRAANQKAIFKNARLSEKEHRAGKTVLTARPSTAKLSLTAICNVRCPFCNAARIAEASELARKHGMRMQIPILDIHQISDWQSEKDVGYVVGNCFWPFRNLEVDAGGEVLPCCSGFPRFANLNDLSLEAVWNDPVLVKLRASRIEKRLNHYCRKCHYAFKKP